MSVRNIVKKYKQRVLSQYINFTRRLRHPQKYKSIAFLYQYLDDKSVKLNKKAEAQKKCIISQVSAIDGLFYLPNCAAFVKNKKDADRMMRKGAALLITDTDYEDYPCMIADNPMFVFAKLCRYYRDLYPDTKVIAVTGSIGKTTTKDMVGVVLDTAFKTVYSQGSANSTPTLARAVQHIPKGTEYLLEEVAESNVGGTQYFSYLLYPDVVVLTPIDLSHFELFGSEEKIIENVCDITKYMNPQGKVIVNIDEFKRFDLLNGKQAVTVSKKNKNADYYTENIKTDGQGLTFDVVISKSGERCRVRLNEVYAPHNASVAISAFAVGMTAGMPVHKIVEGLANYRTSGVRQNVFRTDNHVTVYADCYNAVAKSVKAAVDACDMMPVKGKRIAILGDIEEAGDMSDHSHNEVIDDVIHSKFKRVYIVGSKMTRAAEEKNIASSIKTDCFATVEDLLSKVKNVADDGDLVLLKASHSINLYKCIATFWPQEYKNHCKSLDKETIRQLRKTMYY